jgi:phosphoribosyl 1,2-cyclic phosphodiesterase
MEVRFWGTRGSLPASLSAKDVREKVHKALEVALENGLRKEDNIESFMDAHLAFCDRATYGTSTSCIEVRDGNNFILCDAGSGLRNFGENILGLNEGERPHNFHLLLSHLHWDHIQGFPFFVPAHVKGNNITIYGCHPNIKKAFTTQQSPPFFPVEFNNLAANIKFTKLKPGEETEIEGFKVTPIEQNHPGRSFGFRFKKKGKVVVYSTDAEHKNEQEEDMSPFTGFFNRADLLIFDAQYTFADAVTVKEDWGHSNNLIGVEMAQKAKVKHLCLYHQDPGSSDQDLDRLLEDTRKLAQLLRDSGKMRVSIAYDGMVIKV